MNKKINVQVKKDGKILVETEDYKGDSCVTAIKELFAGFFEIESFEYKSDYYEEEEKLSSEVDINL